jgi:hypothetical protein
MNAGVLPIVPVLLAVPAVIFLALYFLTGRRALVAGVATTLIGAAAGAFLASAGSAMATSVNPGAALLRGALIGFAGSAAVAAILTLAIRALRAASQQTK